MKARMARNVIAHCAERRADAFAHMPVSFVIQPGEGAEHSERVRFAEYENTRCSESATSQPLSSSTCHVGDRDPAGASVEPVSPRNRVKWIAKSTHGAKGASRMHVSSMVCLIPAGFFIFKIHAPFCFCHFASQEKIFVFAIASPIFWHT